MFKLLRRFHDLLLYGMLVFIFVVIFLTNEFIFEKYFPRVKDIYQLSIEAFLIVVIYEPLRKLIELYIKKILFNYFYRRQERLRRLDSKLSSSLSYKEMADLMTEKLRTILDVGHVSLYLKIPEMFSLVSSTGSAGLQTRKIKTDMPYYDKIFERRRVLGAEEILQSENGHAPQYSLDVLKHEGSKYIIPLFEKDGVSGIIAVGPESNDRYELSGEDKKILWQSLQRVGHTLENARLYAQLRKSVTEKELILGVAKKFNSEIHLEKLLDMILDAIQSIVPYDAAGIFLVNETNQDIERAVVRGYNEKVLDQLKIKVGMGLIGHVVNIGKPIIVKDVNFDEHYILVREDTQSQITVPINDGSTVIGVLNLESDKLGAYHEGYLDILSALAGEAGIAIKNAQLSEEAIRNDELEKELKIAGKLQQAILPQNLPAVPNLEMSARNIQCNAVGGDFYDVIKLSESQIGVCIGDVAGKGVPGAIMMSVLFTSYRGMVREFKMSSEVVSALNNVLCANTAEGRYATFFYCIIDFQNLVMYYTNAGHNPPLVLKKSGEWLKLEEGGIVLGFMLNQEFTQTAQDLESGDILVLYTDGVTEAFSEEQDLFGEERLKKIIQQNRTASAKEIQNKIIQEVSAFAPDSEQQDDITLVVIKIGQKQSE